MLWIYALPAFKKLFEASTGKELLAGFGITDKDMEKFQFWLERQKKSC